MQANLSISKQPNQRRKSNQLEKICSKLELSVKDIKDEETLSKSVKLKIQKLIQNDEVKQLHAYLDKKVLSYEVEIGINSMKWNIMHFAAKNNAQKIIKVILMRTYQQSEQKYKQLLNKQTSQGYTALMISIINGSRECFQLFLQHGGFDVECVDKRKMTAYDLALSYKNQFAIKELMSYCSKNGENKQGMYINEKLLMKPLDPALYSQSDWYLSMMSCFLDFCLCFRQDDQLLQTKSSNQLQPQKPFQSKQNFLQKNFTSAKIMSLLRNSQEIPPSFESIPIGNKEIQSKYSIQWRRLSTVNGQKPVLFDCFQPFDICENNLIIANNLILFQCLSDHTWLLRKIVKQVKKIEAINYSKATNLNKVTNQTEFPNQYSIEIYFQDQLKKVTVDEYIPFLKQREQPMFLSNPTEMWPQILQKGLAKIYGSYMKLSEIKPIQFLQNITGCYTKAFTLEQGISYLRDESGQFIKEKTIMTVLQQFSAKGYVVLLQGRQDTTLSPQNTPSAFKSYCYTILNFYQKSNRKLILVNCPYVLNSWKEKEKTETMQLKLIKSHYNSHNQMCVWIEESQFSHFFKTVIVSFAEPNVTRTQMKIRFLLESEVETVQQAKRMSILENITTSAKNILSSIGEKRDSVLSISNFAKQNDKVSLKLINLQVNRLKIITRLVFVKFRIQNSKSSEYLSLAVKDAMSHKFCRIKQFKGWIDAGLKDMSVQEVNSYCSDVIKLPHKKGEYICMFEALITYDPTAREGIIIKQSLPPNNLKPDIQANQNLIGLNNQQQKSQNRTSISIQKTIKKHQLYVICWSQDPIHLEHIEQEFAVIDCLESWRKNMIKNWSFVDKKQAKSDADLTLKYITQRVGQKMIMMTKSFKDTGLLIKIQGDKQIKEKLHDFVHQGYLDKIQEDKIENKNSSNYLLNIKLVHDLENSEFQYAVIGGYDDLFMQVELQNFKLNSTKQWQTQSSKLNIKY